MPIGASKSVHKPPPPPCVCCPPTPCQLQTHNRLTHFIYVWIRIQCPLFFCTNENVADLANMIYFGHCIASHALYAVADSLPSISNNMYSGLPYKALNAYLTNLFAHLLSMLTVMLKTSSCWCRDGLPRDNIYVNTFSSLSTSFSSKKRHILILVRTKLH